MFLDDLVWEILRWIPVKSLMQFKCVSRTWLSIITDPRFAKCYRGGSRCLLSFHDWIFRASWLPLVSFDEHTRFEFLNLDHDNFTIHIVNHGHALKKACTNIVDGLICFYRGEQSWLYNIATREMVKLPDLTFGKCKEAYHSSAYHLGYDPITKRYKLLNTSDDHAAILTIGDSLWRNISPSVKSIDMTKRRGACLDGNICWEEGRSAGQTVIVCFNLAEEKFVHIDSLVSGSLISFGPSLILTRSNNASTRHPDQILYYDYKNGIWINQPFMPPRLGARQDVDIADFPCIVGVLPNGKLLLIDCFGKSPIYQLYLFDLLKKEWEPIVTDTAAARICRIKHWFYFEENIISLIHLTSGHV
ncbi:OLC1v1006914C1 [Oldenlandia corymbosa var. corymbosa]|uniref:OLC1v1006914C1 n=1 Tax=Oldenlandia corymbosa var. corymbosa TaxID=529605 RepID=A0AAV1DIF0_OLDCO|nr:OLC1v1006914C1 [Oldenlandia corymbosa var. corymbosa]